MTWLLARLATRVVALTIAFASAGPQRCSLSSRVRDAVLPISPVPLLPDTNPPPPPRPPPPPKPALPPFDQLPSVSDEVVVHALDRGRAAFQRCFVRARRVDPTLRATKINVHVFLDPEGAVLGVETDIGDAALAACVSGVAKRLAFPPPGRAAVANIAFVAS